MERIKELDRYQKGIVILLAVMAAVFLVIYCVVSSRVGYRYQDRILVPETRGDNTVYAGRIQGEDASFTVAGSNTVTFRWGSTEYGPYTVTEDPTAIPRDEELADSMTGIEVREKGEVLFRGGVLDLSGNTRILYREDGRTVFHITVNTSSGTVYDADGNLVDPMEPSVHTILELLEGPKLEKKGQLGIWFMGLLCSAVIVVHIFFADELFRFRLSFRVADPYDLEPSDGEIFGRYASWTITTVMILVIYIMGLQ